MASLLLMEDVMIHPILAQVGRRIMWWYRFWKLVETFGLLPVLLGGALAVVGFVAYVSYRTRDWYQPCHACFPSEEARQRMTVHFSSPTGAPTTPTGRQLLVADPASHKVHLRSCVRETTDGFAHVWGQDETRRNAAGGRQVGSGDAEEALPPFSEAGNAALRAFAMGRIAAREIFDASLSQAEEHFVPTLREAAAAGRLNAIAALAADDLGRPLFENYLRAREQREPNVAEMLMFRAGFMTVFLPLASRLLEARDRPDVTAGAEAS